jgi:serine protease Do
MSGRRIALSLLFLGSTLFTLPIIAAEPDPAKTDPTKIPASVSELKAMQSRIQETVKKVMPATVGVMQGNSAGSGVIVSEDGYVLTAAHVIHNKSDQPVTIILPDGKRLKAKTLGANSGIDSGMIKITDPGKYPFVAMGDSSKLKKGEWCFSLGHPGGYQAGRKPVLRVGRVLEANDSLVRTDCTLVGGDSGGPLFDLDGNVIGIHSRIGPMISFNIHVPVDTFRDTWDRLVKGDTFVMMKTRPEPPPPPPPPSIDGAKFALVGGMLRIQDVTTGSLAEKAGLKAKDYLLKIEGKEVSNQDDIGNVLKNKKAGDTVTLDIERAGENMSLKIVLAKAKS